MNWDKLFGLLIPHQTAIIVGGTLGNSIKGFLLALYQILREMKYSP